MEKIRPLLYIIRGILHIKSDLIFSISALLVRFSEIKATLKTWFFGERSLISQEMYKNMQLFLMGGYSRDPYLNSGILFMPLMSTLVSLIYGSSGDNFSEKSERWTF